METPIDISEDAGIRYLHFGSDWVQGAMRIRKPDALVLEYTRELLAGLLLRPAPWPRRILLIGLGAGSLSRYIHRHLPEARSTVVEIAPEVHMVAHQYFRLPTEDERFEVVIADGAAFMNRSDHGPWDLIVVDGFDRHARAGALAQQPFYAACRARLSPEGLVAVNMFGELRGFKAQAKRFTDAFDGQPLFLPPCESGNVVALGRGEVPVCVPFTELQARDKALKAATGLGLAPTLKRIKGSRGASLLQGDSLRF